MNHIGTGSPNSVGPWVFLQWGSHIGTFQLHGQTWPLKIATIHWNQLLLYPSMILLLLLNPVLKHYRALLIGWYVLSSTHTVIGTKHCLALVNTVSLHYSWIYIYKSAYSLKCICNPKICAHDSSSHSQTWAKQQKYWVALWSRFQLRWCSAFLFQFSYGAEQRVGLVETVQYGIRSSSSRPAGGVGVSTFNPVSRVSSDKPLNNSKPCFLFCKLKKTESTKVNCF